MPLLKRILQYFLKIRPPTTVSRSDGSRARHRTLPSQTERNIVCVTPATNRNRVDKHNTKDATAPAHTCLADERPISCAAELFQTSRTTEDETGFGLPLITPKYDLIPEPEEEEQDMFELF